MLACLKDNGYGGYGGFEWGSVHMLVFQIRKLLKFHGLRKSKENAT